MKPIISFITPVYNNTKYLRASIESILNQVSDDTPIEIIIVDDGSTDETPLLVDEIVTQDERIKAIHQENQWIYASFNNGIKVSKGEFFYILNSDDLLFDGAVYLLLEAVKKYDYPDVIWTKVFFQNVDSFQNVIDGYDINSLIVNDEYINSIQAIHEKWNFLQKSGVIVNQANLYKKKLWEKHHFKNDYYAGDTLFNISIADDITTMAVLSTPIYRYLSYGKSGFNASIGKCYGYEHEMFNEMMYSELSLLDKWGVEGASVEHVIFQRLRSVTYEIEQLAFDSCKLSNEDKINKIFTVIADTDLRRYFSIIGKEREYESRILTGTKKLIAQIGDHFEIPEFVEILIRYLPENHLDDIDDSIVDKDLVVTAIYDKNNRDEIGKVYYFTKW